MGKYNIIMDTLSAIAEATLGNEKVKKSLFGEYSDGKARNLPDAIRDEKYSPQQKKRKNKKKKKKKYNSKFTF